MQSSSARVGAQVMVLPAPASDCAVQSPNPHRVDAVRKRLLSDELYVDIAETFRALADSTRAKIVHALTDQSLCVGDLAQVVGVSEPAVAQHLRLLAYFADRPRASHGQDGLLLPRGCPCALLTDDGSGPPAGAGASGHIEPFEVSDSCVPRAGLVLGVVALLVVMLLAGPAHASLETPWHGPDMHGSVPHPAPGSTLLTAAPQPGVGLAESVDPGPAFAVYSNGFRVVAQLDASRLDHPPR